MLSAKFDGLISGAEESLAALSDFTASDDVELATAVETFLVWSRREISELAGQMGQLKGLLASTQQGYEQVEQRLRQAIAETDTELAL